MLECTFRHKRHSVFTRAADGAAIDVYHCSARLYCTDQDHGLKLLDGSPLPVCATCDQRCTVAQPPPRELVGDMLHQILTECGINRPACGECERWRLWMNERGVKGCNEPAARANILQRLNVEAAAASWMETIKVAGRGYLSTGAILDEAIRRAVR